MKKIKSIFYKCVPPIVWTLILSIPYYLISFELYGQILGDEALTVQEYYMKGLLLIIPFSLFTYGAKRFKHIYQFLLIGIAMFAFAYFILDCIFFAIFTACIWIARFYSRARKDVSTFDDINNFLFGFLAAYFIGAGMQENYFLQKITVYHFIIVTVLTFVYYGLQRFDHYINIRKDRANIPVDRILNNGIRTFMFLGMAVLLTTFTLVRYFYVYQPVNLPQFEVQQVITSETVESDEMTETYSYTDIFGETEVNPVVSLIWDIVEVIVIVSVSICLVLCFIYAIYKMIKNFGEIQIDKNDIIESTFIKDDTVILSSTIRKFDNLFDFSKKMRIRRQYKKALKKHKPQTWQTPTEMEKMANLDIPELHNLYEKARYSNLDLDD